MLAAGSRREQLLGRHLCGGGLLAAPACVIAAQLVGQAAGGDGDQPATWILGDALLGPLDGGREERLLHRVLARSK